MEKDRFYILEDVDNGHAAVCIIKYNEGCHLDFIARLREAVIDHLDEDAVISTITPHIDDQGLASVAGAFIATLPDSESDYHFKLRSTYLY